ncbi:cytochrome P450 [Ktedonosporobacter rubrisoli]|uniref:Cytochrome P450 n=1 Tax=Ktedonosporobacter rubrisoli TaxID=2509675 RepID=A0A4P6K523_KTERU|nr:cytochrome P450 [Ktedonosporobacter rubrisoli]QBD82940.1 cytochrome P450 [Ktedonosporobacter rubrisoli]
MHETTQPQALTNLPMVGDLVHYEQDRLAYLKHLKERHGDLARFDHNLYFAFDPEIIEQTLLRTHQEFIPDDFIRPAGIPYSTAQIQEKYVQWKQFRSGLPKALHVSRVQAFAPTISALAEQHLATWHPRQQLNFSSEMQTLLSRITVQYFFGAAGEALIPLINAFIDARFQFFNSPYSFPKWFPHPKRVRLRKLARQLHGRLLEWVQHTREHPAEEETLLSFLLAATGRDEQPLTDHLICLILAANLFQAGPTTISALSWLWWLLAEHAEPAQKFYQEIDHVLAGRAAVASDLSQLKYVECAIKETLRLYPPVWQIGRDIATDGDLCGYTCSNGKRIRIVSYLAHRDPRYFQEPDAFRPERWLDEEFVRKVHKGAYIPFGTGPTRCLGSPLALTEIGLISVLIAQRFHLRLPAKKHAKVSPHLVLRPDKLTLIVEPR